jgi:hypothetical protein
MMRRSGCLAVLLGAAAVAAAPAVADEPAPPGQDVDPSIADGSAQKALDQAKLTWLRRGPRSYTYRLQLSCYCTQDSVRPRTFVVRGGKPRHPPKGWKSHATVPRLFKLVQEAIDDRVDGLRVEYRANGSLKLLSVDRISMAIDDEYAYFVDRFKRLR